MDSTDWNPHENPHLDEWKRAWYHEAVTDIRWAKDRSWGVLQGAIILLAAILTASKTILVVPAYLYILFLILVGATAIGWLFDLNQFARKARTAIEEMQTPLGPYAPYPRARQLDPHHNWYLGVHVVLVLAVAMASVLEILRAGR